MQDIDEQLTGLIHDWFSKIRGQISAGKSEFLGGEKSLLERDRILLTIGRSETMTQKRLAELIAVSPQSMSESLAKLEHDGYITRHKNQLDKRETIVALTAAGTSRSDEIAQKMHSGAHRILSPLSDDEKQTLYSLLKKIIFTNSCE